MKTPCEQIVWDVIPAIRAAVAAGMVRKGATQLEVSRQLGMAPSAVSQYLSKKRGCRIVFDGEIRDAIDALAGDLIAGDVDDLSGRICEICMQLRSTDTPCSSCRDENGR